MAFSEDIAFEYLARAHRNGRLGHAYLFAGPPGSGKARLAARLCGLINGPGPGGNPLTHPDVRSVSPESKSRRIRIDQIRELEQVLRLKSSGASRKIAILRDADRLQPQASNAFLKTLEEPPANCLLLLLTAQPESLLDTILSRCITVQLRRDGTPPPTPAESALLDLLAGAAGHGGLALPEVFCLVRDFQELLAGVKARIADQHAEEFKADEAHYKKTSDGRWLEEREDYFKALTESRYLSERARLLEVFVQWWADVLRQQRRVGQLDYPQCSEATAALAREYPEGVLDRIERLDALRDHLERNVQESLALEAAFLEVFAAGQ